MKFVTPPLKLPREVKKEDYGLVEIDSMDMMLLCKKGNGKYPSAYAIAHNQVSLNPLKFFVLSDGRTIINPEVINHTKVFVDHQEGCLSYPDRKMATVKRWVKCTVKYTELSKNWEIKEMEENLSGLTSLVFQHEIDHLNGIDIYSKEGSRELDDSFIGTLSQERLKNLERKNEV